MNARPREREGGFTLVELLLSAAILTIIMTAISGAMITFFSNAQYTTERDDHSGGAAILASYLDRDLASAERATYAAAGAACHAGAKDLVLEWDEWTAGETAVMPTPGQAFSTAYDVVSDGAGGHQLERWYCAGTTVVTHTVLLRQVVDSDFGPGPGVSCPGSSTGLTVNLDAYAEDAADSSYTYVGCLRGRLG